MLQHLQKVHKQICHFFCFLLVGMYSLTTIKQNYNLDMLAAIWHENVS